MSDPAARRTFSPRRLWRQLSHNWLQKLLALISALVCWYFATEDRRATVQQRFEVPITVRDNTHSGEKRAVSGLTPERAQVTLSGSRQRLSTLNTSDISAYIDVTDQPEGPFNRPVRVDSPENTRSVKVNPENAQGQLDAQQSRRQSVQVSLLASESADSPIYRARPSEVTVSGPSRLVSSVTRVVTVPFRLSQGESRPARLLALNLSGEVVAVAIEPPEVMVSRQGSSLPMHTLPVSLNAAPPTFKVKSRVEPPSVRILGPLPAGVSSVAVSVPYRAGHYSVQPDLQLPPGTYSPDKVTVTLTVEPR